LILLLIILINPSVLIKNLVKDRMKVSFLVDNSKSMSYHVEINQFKKDLINKSQDLKEKNIDHDIYLFGSSFERYKNINNINFSDSITNFSILFDEVDKLDSDKFLLISDGQNNYGQIDKRNLSKASIETFGVGDEFINKEIDIKIDTLYTTDTQDDSIKFKVGITTTNFHSQSIFFNLDNKVVNNKNIFKYKIADNNKYIYQFVIHQDSLSANNLFYITPFNDELDKDNNYFLYKIDESNLNKKNILLISGGISPNTQVLKNKILKNNNFNILHIYSFDKENKINKYFNNDMIDGVVMDNFPIDDNQLNFIYRNKEIFNKNIIFIKGPSSKNNYKYYNNFLKDFGFKVISSSENSEYYIFNVNEGEIEPIVKKLIPYNYDFKVINKNKNSSIKDLNNSTILDFNKNNLFVFIPNLNELSNRSLNIYNNDYYHKLIEYYIDKIIFGDYTNKIKIYTLKDYYIINDSFKVYIDMSNVSVNKENLKLKLYDKKGDFISEFNNFEYADKDLIFYNIDIKKSGKYNVQAQFLDDALISNVSNSLEITVNKKDLEEQNIRLNSSLLKKISQKNNGTYYSYDSLDNYLENIKNTGNFITRFSQNKFFNFQGFWLIIIILLFVEWIIRKNKGML